MSLFDPAVTKTILREGGAALTDDPDDPGGPTRYGIAQNYHAGVDAKTLTEEAAKAIYRKDYWDPICGDAILNQAVAEMLFDSAVNLGNGATIRLAQQGLALTASGTMDAATVTTLNMTPSNQFGAAFTIAKIARYVHLCETTPVKKKYFFGWVRRALEDQCH